jgi:molybdate transport system permease protein
MFTLTLVAATPSVWRAGEARRDWDRAPRLGTAWLEYAASGLMVAFLALPLLGLLLRAVTMGELWASLTRPIALDALKLSMLTTTLVLAVALALGSPLALVLARRRFPGRILVDTLVDLPIVLPPAVAGLALLMTIGRRGFLGPALYAVGIQLPFTTAAVVVAAVFVAAPFYIRAARAGFLAVPHEIEEAARVEGASDWQVFRFVTAPAAGPALLGGAILCGARALGEFGATIMFAGSFEGRTQTLPLAIYAALESDLDAAVGMSVVLLLVSAVALVIFRVWLGRTLDNAAG